MKQPPWLLLPEGARPEIGGTVALDPAEARHATGPLRLRAGDPVVLADGAGTVAGARLREASKVRVEAEVTSLDLAPQPEGPGVTLAVSVVENRAMDWVVQKSVEVGLRTLIPMVSERTQAGPRDAERRLDHWRRIAMQALKQCRRPWAMAISGPLTTACIVEQTPPGCGVVADHGGEDATSLPASAWVLAVGPEGGFSPSEDRLFLDRGWHRLCLGPHVLRAETAAIVGGAFLVSRLQHAP
ncbi:MAG TPA: RsmE family RNA methyltransferase [Chondromyces sp.]|nr:RsmE family RNA methyltransferase [Chondromyces sp.]